MTDLNTRTADRPSAEPWLKPMLLVLAAGLMASAFRFLPVAETFSNFLEYVRGLGVWGPVLLAAVYVVATVAMAPGLILTLGAGFLFGVVVGTITVSMGSVLGATAAFLVGRNFGRGFVEAQTKKFPKFAAIDQAVEKSGLKIVMLTRLSPLFPFNVLNYLYGATKVNLKDYVLASWIGMLPGTILYVYLGHAAGNLTDLVSGNLEGGAGKQALLVVGLLATAAVTVVITRVARKALAEATPAADVDAEN